MQQIYTARDSMDAHFLKGLLEQEGLEAVVQGEALEEVWGDLPLTQKALPSVWVKESDVQIAEPIVQEYDRRKREQADGAADASRPRWKCPRCGEEMEDQFTQCWHCNSQRPQPAAPAV